MAITRATDPITDNEVVIITGVVERIKIVEAEQTAKNIEYGVTHIASIVVDNQWINYISLGIKGDREPNITINQGTKDSPKWVEINEGDKVKVIVTETVKGDKTYYNAKRTGIKLVEKGSGSPQKGQSTGGQGGSSQSYQSKPKDMTGVSTGHALNGAMNFITAFGLDASNENIIEIAKKVHNVTEKVKVEYASANPDSSAYDIGAAVGNSVLNACKLVGTENDFEQGVQALALDFLGNVVPDILKHVKGDVKPETPAKVTRAAPAKKASVSKAKPAPEPEEDLDDGSDLPF